MKHKPKTILGQRFNLIAGLVLIGLLTGCATTSHPLPAAGSHFAAASEDQGWWAIRFRMDRANGQTRWERDLLIAHQLIVPILMDHGQAIHLWRFHRRSAEDNTGHQFSFLFYTSASQANLINRRVMDDPLLNQLLTRKDIREVLIDGGDDPPRRGIGDTSDRKWSPVMQAAWPYYIMGVSRMWLDMIIQISGETAIANDATPDQLMDHYATVNVEVSQIWSQEAYHALLHHLNAIYGYRPIVYWEKRIKAF